MSRAHKPACRPHRESLALRQSIVEGIKNKKLCQHDDPLITGDGSPAWNFLVPLLPLPRLLFIQAEFHVTYMAREFSNSLLSFAFIWPLESMIT